MKGLTKTIVALALVITVLATMGMSAMAASYSTKTTYQADNKVSVEANATGLLKGDIVTYVATTDEEDVNENTIVYINQEEADEDGNAQFTYTTEVTNINASMFFGGSTESSRVEATHTDDYVITVTVNGEEAGTTYAAEQAEDAGVVIRKFDLTNVVSLTGVKVTGVKFNGDAINDYCADATTLIVSTGIINGNGTLDITIDAEAAEFVAPKISSTTAKSGDNLVAVAKAVSGGKFGIVLYTDTKPTAFTHAVNDTYATDGYLVLPALGKNVDGIYAVELEAYADYLGATVNVAAYALNGTTCVLSDAVAVE